MELADTSAWFVARRQGAGALGDDFARGLVAGRIATCDMVRFELLYSVRNGGEMAETAAELAVVPDCPIGKPQWARGPRRLPAAGRPRRRAPPGGRIPGPADRGRR